MINIVEKKSISFILSSVFFFASLMCLIAFGLKPGIDFTGGTLFEVRFTEERPSAEETRAVITDAGFESVNLQPTGEDGYIMKMAFITEDEHQTLLSALRDAFETEGTVSEEETEEVLPTITVEGDAPIEIDVEDSTAFAAGNRVLEERLETIGPSISSELRSRSIRAGFVVILGIVMFIAYSFRRVSKPVSSWKYGLTAIIALVHDVTITMGVFALLGEFAGVEVDIPFVVAMLTILGYSVNDTIVVFDRVREKLIKRGRSRFAETVNIGVNETITRSINTSLTTLCVLAALFFFGGDSVHYFSLALMIGIALGTYSSIFLASPLLVVWQELKKR